MVGSMKIDRMNASFDAALGDEFRRAARETSVRPSSRLAAAAAAKLRGEALRDFLDAWEGEHGAWTREELGRAEAELDLRSEPWPC